jgi:5-methyltetrahydrofolate corrinoid/iron sulfur protein methyltransferase
MKIIGENIHIISKKTREAIDNKDADYVIGLAKKQLKNADWIDLNIGPARYKEGTMKWLIETLGPVCDKPFSFDTTNFSEMKSALENIKNPTECIINSTNADDERLEPLTDLAAQFGSYIIGLTLSESGIPKTADERYELASKIIEVATAKGIASEKIIIDPLVLPIGVAQDQAQEAFDTIRMTQEAFDPPVLNVVGLSNISNGSPKEIRPLINRTFAILAMGCGLKTAIADGCDDELARVNQVIETGKTQKSYDKLILDLYEMMQNYGDLDEITYDKKDAEAVKIYKTAEILLNKKIYSHSYLDI